MTDTPESMRYYLDKPDRNKKTDQNCGGNAEEADSGILSVFDTVRNGVDKIDDEVIDPVRYFDWCENDNAADVTEIVDMEELLADGKKDAVDAKTNFPCEFFGGGGGKNEVTDSIRLDLIGEDD